MATRAPRPSPEPEVVIGTGAATAGKGQGCHDRNAKPALGNDALFRSPTGNGGAPVVGADSVGMDALDRLAVRLGPRQRSAGLRGRSEAPSTLLEQAALAGFRIYVPPHVRRLEGGEFTAVEGYWREGGFAALDPEERLAVKKRAAEVFATEPDRPESKGFADAVRRVEEAVNRTAPTPSAGRSRAREALKRVPTEANVGADEVPNWEGLSSRQPPTGAPGSVVLHDTPGGEAFFQRVANAYDEQGRLASTAQADIAKVARDRFQPGEVKALYVATRPDARRQGYATKLYDALRGSGLDIVPAVGQRGVSAEGAPFARSYLKGLAGGREVHIFDEAGGMKQAVAYGPDGKQAGYMRFRDTRDGELHVEYVSIAKESRRKGVATEIAEHLHVKYPDATLVHSDFTSPGGLKFAEAMVKAHPEWNRIKRTGSLFSLPAYKNRPTPPTKAPGAGEWIRYHETEGDFSEFAPEKQGAGNWGKGIYTRDAPEQASGMYGHTMLKLKVTLRRPLAIDEPIPRDMLDEVDKAMRESNDPEYLGIPGETLNEKYSWWQSENQKGFSPPDPGPYDIYTEQTPWKQHGFFMRMSTPREADLLEDSEGFDNMRARFEKIGVDGLISHGKPLVVWDTKAVQILDRIPIEMRSGFTPRRPPGTSALARLTHVVVPPYLRMENGKVVHVEGYTYERAGAGDLSSLRTATKTAPAPTSLLAKTDIQDQRKHGKQPIHLDADKLEAAATAVGIDISKVKSLKLRFRDLSQHQGVTQNLGDGNFRVVVGIAPKEKYEERHLYVVNNSLVHELRHVTQMQNGNKTDYLATKEEFGAANLQHAKAGGYVKMEAEAQMFGRLAWHGDPAKKPLGPLGEDKGHMGKTLWAIGFTPEVKLSKVEDLAMKLEKP